MRLDAFLLADAVAAAEGKVYIHGGSITRLEVPSLPFPVAQLGVYARLQPDDEEELRIAHRIRLVVVGPTGRPNIPPMDAVLSPPDLSELLDGEVRFMDLILNIGGIRIFREGLHRVELYFDDEILGSSPLPVRVIAGDHDPERDGTGHGDAG